ncbi:DUF5681 domain-containing protein [Qipengyuania vesicularis]|uniref:DUF5681 domain-containing protein n=1 Tax=Qipengyuania vesicularis TaxID=2867232 RepID=UPI001C8738BF|nr:DUF5681 domain-containing protein [Qipengyuania vesicularis]MBX7528642.1 hypothetical protein [Qipengyuania vesicularis]
MSAQEPVGYGNPPASTRFKKGRSGNPRGRPRNRHRQIPHDTVLGQMVTIKEDGRKRRVTAAEAFLLQLTQRGLAGDSAAARSSLEAIEKARASRGEDRESVDVIVFQLVGLGMDSILEPLGIAKKKHPTDEDRVRWELTSWIVEKALVRVGDRQLSFAEQKEVWDATRTPQKVRWPDWWIYRG